MMEPEGKMDPQGPNDSETGKGEDDPTQALTAIQDAMMSLMQGAKNMPPDAAKALQTATQAYSQFLEIITGAPQGASSQSPANSSTQMGGGNPNAQQVG